MNITMKRRAACGAAITVLVAMCTILFALGLGLVPVYIVGGPGFLAALFWYRTYLMRPVDPFVILPLFMVTVAGFEFNLVEEYLGHYGPAISRLFNIGWSDSAFVVICLLLTAVLCLVSVGLCRRNPVAGFVALLFLFTRVAEVFMFTFPLLRPALQPTISGLISQSVTSGTYVADMPNYYLQTTGVYYFPGLYTAAFPIFSALYALSRLWQIRPRAIANAERPTG